MFTDSLPRYFANNQIGGNVKMSRPTVQLIRKLPIGLARVIAQWIRMIGRSSRLFPGSDV